MPPIHLDDVTSSAAIDIFILLTISIGIVAEIRRNPPLLRGTATKQRQSPGSHETLTLTIEPGVNPRRQCDHRTSLSPCFELDTPPKEPLLELALPR